MRVSSLLLWGAFALAPACALAQAAAVAGIALELRANALISHARITLADVAATDDAALAAIELGQAPRVGYVERLSRQQIEHALRRRVNLEAGALAWSGADSVAVRVKSQTVTGRALAAAAVDAVTARFGSGARIAAIVPTQPADIDVPAAPSWRARLSPISGR